MMGSSSLFSHSSSLCSPTASHTSAQCPTDGWHPDANYAGHYIKYIKPDPANSPHGTPKNVKRKPSIPHPLLQACSASSSTTSLTRSPPVLSIMIPKSPQPQSFPARSPSNTSSTSRSQPRHPPAPNFLKKANNTITAAALVKLLENESHNVLLFDLRSCHIYEAGYISQAINVVVPMRKLRKTSFTLEKMIMNFIHGEDKEKVERWNEVGHIVAYDSDFEGPVNTAVNPTFYLLEKFVQEGWKGETYVLEGGFKSFAEDYPEKIDEVPYVDEFDSPKHLSSSGASRRQSQDASDNNSPVALAYSNQGQILRAWRSSTGKHLPQNRDSWDAVDEISITLPSGMTQGVIDLLPSWLLRVYGDGGSKLIAEKFRLLEQAQVQRFNSTDSTQVLDDGCNPPAAEITRYQLAGSHTNSKNRYRDIYPYEHSRVKLSSFEDRDYINASHLSVQNSSKKYIASQAPTPAAFNDFWSMVWEQEVNVIVMLTTTEEAFRVVAHNYWTPGQYGPLKLSLVSDQMILLDEPPQDAWHDEDKPKPIMHYISVRRFALVHRDYPFSEIRGITQIQDLAWPDFGVPDDPGHILRLINYTNQVFGPVQPTQYHTHGCCSPSAPSPRKPIIVQCSAGCGRTGVFCTLDAVIDQLRYPPYQDQKEQDKGEDGNSGGIMLDLEDNDGREKGPDSPEDLIEKIVGQFRDERMSMVQNLRQFMHCYEVALEWFKIQGQTLEHPKAVEKGDEDEDDQDMATITGVSNDKGKAKA